MSAKKFLSISISLLFLNACSHTGIKSRSSDNSQGISGSEFAPQKRAYQTVARSEPTTQSSSKAIPIAADASTANTEITGDDEESRRGVVAAAHPPPAQSTATDVEDDYAALYGGSGSKNTATSPVTTSNHQVDDPWERYNRYIHRFNLGVDRYIAHPLAVAYVKVVPTVCRMGVSNFFDNLSSPMIFVNQILQGHPIYSIQTLGRFVLNTLMGVGGILDPASVAGIPRRRGDFGETMAVWGWRHSRYFELPFFGPRTVRDTVGMAGDYPLSALSYVQKDNLRFALQGIQLVNTRAKLLPLDAIRHSAMDEYTLTRDAWLQQRDYHIRSQLVHDHQSTLYLNDKPAEPTGLEEEGTVPMNAIPLPPQLIH